MNGAFCCINKLMEYVVCIVGYLMQWVGVLMGVAFFTLLERKILGYTGMRKGPNKVGYMGILQPFADAMKLFTKEDVVPMKSSVMLYMISPVLALFIPLCMWCVFPYWFVGVEFSWGWLYVFCGLGMGVYSLFLSGWSSNSKYAVMGSLRAVAQMISYEVVLAMVVMLFVFFLGSYDMGLWSYTSLLGAGLLPLLWIWMTVILGESQRSPFDLAEGESELVSGFNTEYSGVGFALLFMGEYGAILLMSMLSSVLFLGSVVDSIFFPVVLWFFGFVYLWARATFPRVRYDQLMYLAWKSLLPNLLWLTVVGVGVLLMVSY
uniref:NADH-ubiquinone oxidoreductase chain 1 n=1 Tax=Vargula hilgendorfii TaxID=6674 RepID=A0A7R7GYU5_VARHI|nr:NADH dehydrogenase subunit 1 [Vargula hilgendorfii]